MKELVVFLIVVLIVVVIVRAKRGKKDVVREIQGSDSFKDLMETALHIAGGWDSIPSTNLIVETDREGAFASYGGVTSISNYDDLEILAAALHHEDEHHANKYWDASNCGEYEVGQELLAITRQRNFLISLPNKTNRVILYIELLEKEDGRHFDACKI